jgi:flagellar biosynthesis protein FlhG
MQEGAGRIISVGGGKGGVGKSLVAANLAVAFAQAGHRTILIDADLGSPNLHTLLGVDRLPRTLTSFFDRDVDTLEETQLSTSIPGLTLIAGSPAHPGAANVPHAQKLKLLRHVHALRADVVVVDIGAGSSFNALDVFNAADLRLVVMTAQLTAVQNAYGFLKGAVHRALRQLAQGPEQQALIEGDGQAQDTARLRGLLARVRVQDPAFSQALELQLEAMGAFLIGNQVLDGSEANVPHAVSRMVQDFLSLDVPVLGSLRTSRRIHDSVNQRRPWLLDAPGDSSALALREISARLLRENVDALRLARREAETLAESALQPRGASTPLPRDIAQLTRKHPRFKVVLPVSLKQGARFSEGHVLELSRCGALVALAPQPRAGERGSLVFTSLGGAPALEVSVKNVRPEKQTVGLEFISSLPLPIELEAAVARAEASASPAVDPASGGDPEALSHARCAS